jgi:hypothetical protein
MPTIDADERMESLRYEFLLCSIHKSRYRLRDHGQPHAATPIPSIISPCNANTQSQTHKLSPEEEPPHVRMFAFVREVSAWPSGAGVCCSDSTDSLNQSKQRKTLQRGIQTYDFRSTDQDLLCLTV